MVLLLVFFFRRSLIILLLVKICMEESTCHEMVIYLSQIFSSMLCFMHFSISFKYDFLDDGERKS